MAVIFWDFDGTLMHSNSLWSNTVYNALKSVDNDTAVSFTAVRKCMAKGFTWHTPDNDYSKMTGSKWWDFMINKISKDYIVKQFSRFGGCNKGVGIRRIF